MSGRSPSHALFSLVYSKQILNDLFNIIVTIHLYSRLNILKYVMLLYTVAVVWHSQLEREPQQGRDLRSAHGGTSRTWDGA